MTDSISTRTHEARGATRCTAEVRADTARGRPSSRCGNRTADPSGLCAKHRAPARPRRERPTHEQIIASAEHSGFRVTPDRQFIVQRSVTCQKDHARDEHYRPDYTSKVWCQLAHAGHPYGSLFWCDCPCHFPAYADQPASR